MKNQTGKQSRQLNRILEAHKRSKQKDLTSRMVKGYNANKEKIEGKPETEEPTQSELRKLKLLDLISRKRSWSGLETFEMNEGISEYYRDFRKLYHSSRRLSFREWLNEIEKLIDTLQ